MPVLYQMKYITPDIKIDLKRKIFWNIFIFLIGIFILVTIVFFIIFLAKNNKHPQVQVIHKIQDTQKKKTVDEVIIDGKIYIKQVYIIKDGDTLWKISKAYLNDKHAWTEIYKSNPSLKNPHQIPKDGELYIYIPKTEE